MREPFRIRKRHLTFDERRDRPDDIRPMVEPVEAETDGGARSAHLLRTLWGLVEAGWGYEEVAWVFDLDPVLVRDAHLSPS